MVESFAAAKGIAEKTDYKKIPSLVDGMIIDIKRIKDKKQENLSALKGSSIKNEKLVDMVGKQLMDAVDLVKSKTMQELTDKTSDLTKSVEDDIKKCDATIIELELTLEQFKDKKKDRGERECLFNFSKCEEALESAEVLKKEIESQEVKVEFKPDRDITNSISSKQLGNLIVRPESVPRLYAPKAHKIRTAEDQKSCDITAACKLATGHMALVDSRNNKLKKVNERFEVVSEISLSQFPYSVCPVSNGNIAVAICDWSSRNEINIVAEKDGDLIRTQTIKLGHDCVSLGSLKDELFVGSTNGIYVYNIRDLCESKQNEVKDRHIYKIAAKAFALSRDGSKLFIADEENNKIICIDKNGKEITNLPTGDVKSPRGVCEAGNDSAFICGNLSSNVVLFDRSFNPCLRVVASEADGVLKPNCVVYDRENLQLIVGQQDSDNLLVFKMQRM